MYAVKVSQGGRVVIPADLREKLHINLGDELICEERDSELVLASKLVCLRYAQSHFQAALPEGGGEEVSLANELMLDRKKEAAQESKR
ncbi:MAG: AbrB/MazE/SpoVT family DNA-binding domain-containing protein [Pseudomonadales bacterium]